MAFNNTTDEEDKREEVAAQSQPQYVNALDPIVADYEERMRRQDESDRNRIEKLSKGRSYWIGANMLANVMAEAINAWGTANGAPAMQLPEYNNDYMKVWKEADEKRIANRQKLQDYYDRLRMTKIQRDQQIADIEANNKRQDELTQKTWRHQDDAAKTAFDRQTNAQKDRENRIKAENEKNRTNGIDNIMKTYSVYDVTRDEAEYIYDFKKLPPRIQKIVDDEKFNRQKKLQEIRSTGRDKDYDIKVGDVTIGALKKSEYESNLGQVSEIVKKYAGVSDPGGFPAYAANAKRDGAMNGSEILGEWQTKTNEYNRYVKEYGNKVLTPQQINELVRRNNLTDNEQFMNEIMGLAGVVAPETPVQQQSTENNLEDFFNE